MNETGSEQPHITVQILGRKEEDGTDNWRFCPWCCLPGLEVSFEGTIQRDPATQPDPTCIRFPCAWFTNGKDGLPEMLCFEKVAIARGDSSSMENDSDVVSNYLYELLESEGTGPIFSTPYIGSFEAVAAGRGEPCRLPLEGGPNVELEAKVAEVGEDVVLTLSYQEFSLSYAYAFRLRCGSEIFHVLGFSSKAFCIDPRIVNKIPDSPLGWNEGKE